MTISIIFTSTAKCSDAYNDMANIMRACIGTDPAHGISDINPDIVHVFGAFDTETLALLKRYRKLCIPVVLTVYNALATFTRHGSDIKQSHLHILRKQILHKACAVIATGQHEAKALEENATSVAVNEIRNAAVTSTVTAEGMTSQLLSIYNDTVQKHEQAVQQNIAKKVSAVSGKCADSIRKVCALMLFARYLNTRGQLTPVRLSQMGQLLIHSDYDEDVLARTLSKLHITTFTARLLAYMDVNGFITEGFMPIPRASKPLLVITVDKQKSTTCMQENK